MADALSRYRQAPPGNDALQRYRQEPSGDTLGALAKYLGLQGYWDRQGQIAQEGLDMAEQGAQTVRGGDPRGFAGMFLGPAGYLASPITALLPTEAETYAARDLPEWFKPGAAAGIGTMMAVMPGPKGARLGKGMAALAEDATAAERAALASRLEGEAAQSGGQAVTTSRDQALRNLTQAPPEGILAYHGSPHTFDKFDMSKIGTGEGAQAYGHGLYFAESPGVAQSYRDAMKNRDGVKVEGADYATLSPQEKSAAQMAAKGDDLAAEVARLESNLARMRPALTSKDIQAYEADIAATKAMMGRKIEGNPGSMYQVRINAKPEEFLDWDRPLSEQPQVLRDAVSKADASIAPNTLGSELLRPLGRAHRGGGGPGQSVYETEALKAAGIKGIRYKDAGSRGADGGTYNYVVFDDKIIDILKRYGIPMTAGVGGAMVVSGQNMPPELASQMGPQG